MNVIFLAKAGNCEFQHWEDGSCSICSLTATEQVQRRGSSVQHSTQAS